MDKNIRVNGVQFSCINIVPPIIGARMVCYGRDASLTVDTNRGSFIISERELLRVLESRGDI